MAASKPRVEHGPTDDGHLSLRALATYSDMSVRSLRDYLTDANPIPHYRMKGKILVKRSEFDAWMSTHRVRADESLADMVDDVMEARRRSIVHVLRHTFGSLLIQQRESLAYVKEQVGTRPSRSPSTSTAIWCRAATDPRSTDWTHAQPTTTQRQPARIWR
jgi:hypothetical protein